MIKKLNRKAVGKGLAFAMVFTIALFMIGFISAASFDNVVSKITTEKDKPIILGEETLAYNPIWEKYAPQKIDNWLGMGGTLAEMALVEHTASCSNDCYSTFDIVTNQDSALIDDVKFYTIELEKGQEVSRKEEAIKSYQFYIQDGVELKTVDDYEFQCNGLGEYYINGSEKTNCGKVKTGSHIETIPIWKEYNIGDVLPKGTYKVKLIGEKFASRTVDWVIKTQGKEIAEWADWSSIPITETTGITISTGDTSANSAGLVFQTKSDILYLSKVGLAPGFTGTNVSIIDTITGNGIAYTSSITFLTATFSTPVKLNASTNYTILGGSSGANYGRRYNLATSFPVDKTYITWTGGRIIGNPISYTEAYNVVNASFVSFVSLNSPVNYYNDTDNSATFNFTADLIGVSAVNASLWTNATGTWARDSTKSESGTSLTDTITKTFLNAGKYLWGIQVCSDDGNCGWSENRTINISKGSSPTFGLCGTTGDLNIPLVNYTFRDSSTLATLTAYVVSSFNYSSTLNTTNVTYNYDSGTEYSSFAFCGSHHVNYTLYPNIQYASVGYPLTTYSPGKVVYNNATTNITLDLTSSASGIYVTLQVIDATFNQLSGVVINATNSSGGLLGTGTTDSAGTYTFFLEPTRLTTFTFSKEGYLLYTISLYPTQTLYTITLTTAGNVTQGIDAVSWLIYPQLLELSNKTLYNFTVSFNSTQYNFTQYGFNITQNNGTRVGTAMGTGALGGNATKLNLNTGDNSTFLLTGYFIMNNQTYTFTKLYYIVSMSGTEWSISYFFTDLRSYITTGIFGLDALGLNLIVFFAILIITGILSWKYGIYSPMVISVMVFVLTLLFDAGLGLITYPQGMLDHFATVLTGIVMVGILIKEAVGF